MNEAAQRARSPAKTVLALLGLPVLLIAYVLSEGLVGELALRGYIDAQAYLSIYSPLIWLYRHSEIWRQITYWYHSIWR